MISFVFAARDTRGDEPWATDGTPSGRFRLADILAGPGSGCPTHFTLARQTAGPIGPQSVAEDTAWAYRVPANALSDPDGALLTFSAALADGAALPSWLSFDPAQRSFLGTPPWDFTGTIALRVTATDPGGLSASQVFSLVVTPVNDAPVLGDDIGTTPAGRMLIVTVPGLLANDPDADGNGLAVIDVTQPANGTVTFGSGGDFVYTPAVWFAGTDGFACAVTDGSITAAAAVTVTVAGSGTVTQIAGSPGNDLLSGTPGADSIAGLGERPGRQ